MNNILHPWYHRAEKVLFLVKYNCFRVIKKKEVCEKVVPNTAYLTVHGIGWDRWRYKTETCTKSLRCLRKMSKTLFGGWFPQVTEHTLINAFKRVQSARHSISKTLYSRYLKQLFSRPTRSYSFLIRCQERKKQSFKWWKILYPDRYSFSSPSQSVYLINIFK